MIAVHNLAKHYGSVHAVDGMSFDVRPGEVLGLGAALSNTPYETTAELLDSSQVVFVRRKELLKFLREHPDVCMQVVRMLSQDLHGAYERVRSIGMVRSRRPRTIFRPRVVMA